MSHLPDNAIELDSRSQERTRMLGRRMADCLRIGDVVALVGPLGAGKTQWVKGIAAGLGVDPDAVHSPTFTLINEYAIGPAAVDRAGRRLCHVDAYRLGGAGELADIGFEELADEGVVAVEWADRVGELIGPEAIRIDCFLPADAGTEHRCYTVTAPLGRMVELAGALRGELTELTD